MASTIAFVRSRPLSRTWTSPIFQLMPRPKLQPSPSTSKELTSFLPMKPTPTLKVMGMLLKFIKKNSSRTLPVSLKGIRLWRRRMKRPLSFSNSFFFFTCKLLIFDHLKELHPSPPLTLDVNTCLFVGFYSLSLFIRRLCLFIHMFLFVSNFWNMFLFVHLRNYLFENLIYPSSLVFLNYTMG